MSTVARTWLAGLALLFSALVLCASADPQGLGPRAMIALVVLFGHAWVVAVGERACPARGGVDIPRFSLGPRLLSVRPGLLSQCMVPVMMLGVVSVLAQTLICASSPANVSEQQMLVYLFVQFTAHSILDAVVTSYMIQQARAHKRG